MLKLIFSVASTDFIFFQCVAIIKLLPESSDR